MRRRMVWLVGMAFGMLAVDIAVEYICLPEIMSGGEIHPRKNQGIRDESKE